MWVEYNPNPKHKRVGDCVIRAISIALNQNWEKTYSDIVIQGFLMNDMPSANYVWGSYLMKKGFVRHLMPLDENGNTYTVRDFCKEHQNGTYILAIDGHVVTVRDGNYYDSWNSGDELPVYYWQFEKEEETKERKH